MLINRLFLTFLLICIAILTNAQKLYFSDTSNKWTFFCASNPPPGPPDPLYLSEKDFTGYETVNGITYSKFANGTLVREDTATARVIIYVNDTTEAVLYDWSLQIGDTLTSVTQWMTYYSILNSVDTFYYNNVPLVKQVFSVAQANGSGGLSYTAWEGIGCGWDLLYPLEPAAVEPLCGICSFRNSDTQSTQFNGVSCALSVNESNRNQFSLKTYPSPAHDELIIGSSSTDKDALISLVDITGKELLRQRGLSNTNKLSLSNITPGIYFVRIVSNNIRERHKIIIQ